MKKQIKLSYEWWNADHKTSIKEEHESTLEEIAEEHIVNMTAQGFTSGQLCDNVEGVDYEGYWSKNVVNVPYVEVSH